MPNDKLKDRTLDITLTPTLSWFENTILGTFNVYVQTGSKPKMQNVVHMLSGNIDISKMPVEDGYNDNIDITITLDPSQLTDQNGNHLSGRWATEEEAPMPGQGAVWFCNLPIPPAGKDPTPIQVSGMITKRINDKKILIDDDTPDASPPYAFCMGFVLPERGNEFVLIDPVISSKGTSIGNK